LENSFLLDHKTTGEKEEKQSRYRTAVAQRVPGSEGFQIS
jgi:hypothetical protein